jgi:protein TonB
MFHTLLESARPRAAKGFTAGLAVSAAVHTAVIAGLFAAAAGSGVIRVPDAAESILRWLVPPDRGPRPVEVQPLRYLPQDPGTARGMGTDSPLPARAGRGVRGMGVGQEQLAQQGDAFVPEELPTEVAPAFSQLEVDQEIVRHPESAAPAYPPELLARGIEGGAMFRFVVDTTGTIDPASVQMLMATHPAFAQAVREAMPWMRFEPARMGALKVRQLAEQEFRFVIEQRPPSPPATP